MTQNRKNIDDTLYKNKYRIDSTRLKGWDYSSEAYYFITICEKYRNLIFGQIKNGFLCLSPQGQIAIECWHDLPNHYPNCILDKFVLMPNHLHGIIRIDNHRSTHKNISVETGFKPVSTKQINHSLSEIVRGFKTFSAKRINKLQNTIGKPFWQPRFYDHIIRNEKSLNRIRRYILNNPLQWEYDKNKPK